MLLWWSVISAQNVQPFFQKVNFQSSRTGIVVSTLPVTFTPPDVEKNPPNEKELDQVLYSLYNARIGSSAFDGFKFLDYQENVKMRIHESGITPITVVDLAYERIAPEAYTNGEIVSEEGALSTQGKPVSLKLGRAFFGNFHQTKIKSGKVKWQLKQKDVITDKTGAYNIWIDFADGQSWRKIRLDEVIEVNYGAESGERLLKIKVEREGETLSSNFRLMLNTCNSSIPLPDANVPWDTDGNADAPWQISTIADDGALVKGNAYYLPMGVFDKPFIFVEGIDFGYNHSLYANGDFGWCEFTGGDATPGEDYYILAQMPNLLEQLRERGYDIILLDFHDGAEWLERNAALLESLISKVNASKVGFRGNVIAGASMGGVISRYVLAKMEKQGRDHCTSTWISFDAPHRGANIPIALQQLLNGLSEFDLNAMLTIQNKLLRPAARQLLRYQYQGLSSLNNVTNPDLFVAWYNHLNEVGFPDRCTNIAIYSGAGNGLQTAPTYHPLLSYNCELSPLLAGPEVRMYATPSCGDPWFSDQWGNASIPGVSNVSAQLVLTFPDVNPQWYNLWSGGGVFSNKQVRTYRVPAGTPNIDYEAGGIRVSMDEFAQEINASNALTNAGCGMLPADLPDHAFVSTTSALGINSLPPGVNISQWLAANTTECPFDYTIGNQTENRRHCQLVSSDINSLTQLIFVGENEDGTAILPFDFAFDHPRGQHFNFGKQGHRILHEINLNNAHLYVNSNRPLHYGDEGEAHPAAGSSFEVEIAGYCTEAAVYLHNYATMSVGTSGYSTGRVICTSGGSVTLGPNSTLTIHAGSKMIFRSGSYFLMNPGSKLVMEAGAQMIFESGSIFRFIGGEVRLNGGTTEILMDGGVLSLATGAEMFVQGNSNIAGHFKFVSSGQEDLLQMEPSSKLRLMGNMQGNVMMIIANQTQLVNTESSAEIIFQRSGLNIGSNASLQSSGEMSFTQTDVSGTGTSDVIGFQQSIYCNSTNWKQVVIRLNESALKMMLSKMVGPASGVIAHGGTYKISGSDFRNCGVQSTWLYADAEISTSQFTKDPGLSEWPELIKDDSYVTLKITQSRIAGALIGVWKKQNKLLLGCNRITQCNTGVYISDWASGNLSMSDGFGRNAFSENKIHIKLFAASGLNINKGGNSFASYTVACITGSLAVSCNTACTAPGLSANSNLWTPGQWQSNGLVNGNDVYTMMPSPGSCTGNQAMNGQYCSIDVLDFSPISQFSNCDMVVLSSNNQPQRREGELEDAISMPSPIEPEKGEPLGVEESQLQNGYLLYPNPSSGLVRLRRADPSGELNWRVYDLLGRHIASGKIQAGNAEAEIEIRANAGTYHLQLQDDHQTALPLVIE